jgi:hypothetical protein
MNQEAMDSKLRKALTECIRDIETGARDLEGCLQQHPECAWDLRPHLELWSNLNSAPKAEPKLGGRQRGQQQLLGALADMETQREKRLIPTLIPSLAKVAAVVAGVMLLAGSAIGASAALGGPDVAGEVLSGIGISNASDNGKEHANPNAFEGSDNAGQGRENANPNASERCDNSTQGRGNASENAANAEGHPNPRSGEGGDNGQPNENANPRSSDGCLNADADGDGDHGPNENANPNASEPHGPPESVPGADKASDDASVPDSVPAGPPN